MARIEYLKELENRLTTLGLPIHYELPAPSVREPFVVLGISTGFVVPAKSGKPIQDNMQQIDIYLSASEGRAVAERVLEQAVRLVARSQNVSTQMLRDDSIGRDVYHLVIRVTNYIY